MDESTPYDKQIVLIHTQGPTPGLWCIAGRYSQLVPDGYTGPRPPVLGPIPLTDRAGFFNYVWERTRYIVYREILVPGE